MKETKGYWNSSYDGLDNKLLVNDQHLVERFARGSLSLRKLFICNIRKARRETRDALAHMVMVILSG